MTPVASGCGNVAKVGVVLGDVALASQLGCPTSLFVLDRRTHALSRTGAVPGLATPTTRHPRVLERWGDALVIGGYPRHLEIVRANAALELEVPVVAASAAQALWLLDETGLILVIPAGGGPELRQQIAGAVDLAATGDGVVVAGGRTVTALDADGGVRWTWDGPGELTRIDATDERVVVGDVDGRVHLLGADGTLRATARGHERRVAEVRVVDDVAYTASWDGTIRRWGLAAVDVPIEALLAEADAWGLTVDEVQRMAP